MRMSVRALVVDISDPPSLVTQILPFHQLLRISEAVELLKIAKEIQQPTNTPKPVVSYSDYLSVVPRQYIIAVEAKKQVKVIIRGVRRKGLFLTPSRWYIVFDPVNKSVIKHGYWHPKIVNEILDALEPYVGIDLLAKSLA